MTIRQVIARSASKRSLVMVSAMCMALFVSVPIIVAPRQQHTDVAARADQGQGSPWQRAVNGLHGDNVAGLAFVGDPNRNHRFFFMVSGGFGLFRGLTTLEEWRRMEPNPARPETTIVRSTAIARDDIDRLTVYAGMQARPLFGISEDGGTTWRTEDGPIALSRLDHLDSTTAGRIWTAQNMATDLWSSMDGGMTWQIDPNPSGRRAEVIDMFASPDQPLIWFVGAGRLYRSNDAPGVWQETLGPTTAAPPTMTLEVRLAAAAPGGRVWAVGRRNNAWAAQSSSDGGATWLPAVWPAAAGASPPSALGAGEVGFLERAAWIGVDDGLDGGRVFQTRNDGESWSEIVQVPAKPRVVASDPQRYDVLVGTDGLGLFKVDEVVLHTGAVPVDALAVEAPTFATENRAYALAEVTPLLLDLPGSPPPWRIIFRSDDRGVNWTRRYVTTGLGTRLIASPAFASDRRLYSGQHLSSDAGQNWRPLGQPLGGGEPPHVVAVGPITNTRPALYGLRVPYGGPVAGGGSGLLYSGDGGTNWQVTDANVDGITAVALSPEFAVDATAFFVTDRGKVFRTVNAVAFEEVGRMSLIAGQGAVPALEISSAFVRDGTLVAAVDNQASGRRTAVFLSNDRGRTWNERSAGMSPRASPGGLILSPRFELDRTLFLGTMRARADAGEPAIYASGSAGAEWFGEALLGPGGVVDFAWGGTGTDGRLFAAARRDGILFRNIDGSPIMPILPTVTASATAAPATSTTTPTPTLEATEAPPPTPTALFGAQCTDTVADAHAQESKPAVSAGLENELLVWNDDAETAIAYVRFEPPALPPAATVLTATVELWLRAQQNQGVMPNTEMRSISEPWSETRLSWNSRPRLGTATDGRTVSNRPGWESWDVGSVINDWYNQPNRNNGVAIVPTNPEGNALRSKFASRENPFDPAPRLCVTYLYPAPTATITATPTDGPSPTASNTPDETTSPPTPTPTIDAMPSATPENGGGTPTATATSDAQQTPSATATRTPMAITWRVYVPFLVRGR